MKQSMKKVADALLKIGQKNVPEDRHLVYVNDYELGMLEDHSGPGEPDPVTGIRHYDDNTSSSESEGGDGMASSGYDGGEDDSGGLSGFADTLLSQEEPNPDSSNVGPAAGTPGNMGGGWNLSEGRFNSLEEQDAIDAANSKAGNEALGLNQKMEHSVEDAGRGGLDSGRNYTANQDNRGYSTGYGMMDQFGSWSRDNPVLNSAIGVGLGFLNPSLGVVYSGLSQYAKGNEGRGIGQIAGGLAAGPSGATAGGLLGMGIDALGNYVTDSGYGIDASSAGNASNEDAGDSNDGESAESMTPASISSDPFRPVWNDYLPFQAVSQPSGFSSYAGGESGVDQSVFDALQGGGTPVDAIDYLMRQEKEKQIAEAIRKQEENKPATKADIPRLEDYLARRM